MEDKSFFDFNNLDEKIAVMDQEVKLIKNQFYMKDIAVKTVDD